MEENRKKGNGTLDITLKGKEPVKIPVEVAAVAGLLLMKKPKLLIASVAAFLVSGSKAELDLPSGRRIDLSEKAREIASKTAEKADQAISSLRKTVTDRK
ncbi:hypothetical protein [Youngiibacter multivorans]|uniref:DUF4342 domain-containing protein n=1 Tax=Youngiibacter multivorans TaxID=937251 RepID=A0ABS4G0K0_9CLOT|nr:hypothetical protein [Youngiibacter multivorans]MBP1918083.1 hypothetical protein [Youngiibacter multivorans]